MRSESGDQAGVQLRAGVDGAIAKVKSAGGVDVRLSGLVPVSWRPGLRNVPVEGSAATTMAIHDPDHVRVASALLGHASPATTERHYQHAQSLEASRSYAEVVTQLRSNTEPEELP